FNYLVGCKNDKFSGYNYQVYTGPGTKYKLIKEEFYKLILKGNILYSQDEIEDIHRTADGSVINYPNKDNLIANPNQTIQGKVKSYAAFRAKAMYEWKILDNLKFTQDLSYRTKIDSTDNYFVYSKTTILSKISDIFSLGINYKIDYVNAPPEGKKRSDKTTSINLVVNY
ncbi:MAG: DUF481 domain-containing protein, partial [Pseudomonadota bacterium]|nr:DUF481 domain-containing protein [Pseudomonadota bacterium]